MGACQTGIFLIGATVYLFVQRYTHMGNICTETLKSGWRNLVNLSISLGIGEKPRAFLFLLTPGKSAFTCFFHLVCSPSTFSAEWSPRDHAVQVLLRAFPQEVKPCPPLWLTPGLSLACECFLHQNPAFLGSNPGFRAPLPAALLTPALCLSILC